MTKKKIKKKSVNVFYTSLFLYKRIRVNKITPPPPSAFKITCYCDIIKVGCIYLDTMQIQIQSK